MEILPLDPNYMNRNNYGSNHPDCPEGYKFWSNFGDRFEMKEAMNRQGFTEADVVMSGNAFAADDRLINGFIAGFARKEIDLWKTA